MSLFTLQVNDSGSWRNVMKFKPVFVAEAKMQAQRLASLSYQKLKLRIIDAESTVVVYCEGPEYVWKAPEWRVL